MKTKSVILKRDYRCSSGTLHSRRRHPEKVLKITDELALVVIAARIDYMKPIGFPVVICFFFNYFNRFEKTLIAVNLLCRISQPVFIMQLNISFRLSVIPAAVLTGSKGPCERSSKRASSVFWSCK